MTQKINQSDFGKLVEDIKTLEEERDRINKFLDIMIPIMKSNCPHEKVDVRHWYIDGSYLDRSEDHKITYCVVCGTELKDEVSYGYYG